MGAIHERSTTTSQLLAIPGTAHATFTGAPLWLPPVLSLVGSLGRTEDHRIISEATLGFLDAELRGSQLTIEAASPRMAMRSSTKKVRER